MDSEGSSIPWPCYCRSKLATIHNETHQRSIDVTSVFHLAETLISTYRNSCNCSENCSRSTSCAQVVLESIARLLDFFDTIWTDSRDGTTEKEKLGPSEEAQFLDSNATEHSDSSSPTVTGAMAIATVDRYVWDDLERKLLLEEVLRGFMGSMNSIVKDICTRMPQLSKDSYGRSSTSDPTELAETLLERTYSALARYGRPAV